MPQWDYKVTLHKLPQTKCDTGSVVECTQVGECFVHDACRGGIEGLEALLLERGREGWELVQSGYHHGELLCIWKRIAGS